MSGDIDNVLYCCGQPIFCYLQFIEKLSQTFFLGQLGFSSVAILCQYAEKNHYFYLVILNSIK